MSRLAWWPVPLFLLAIAALKVNEPKATLDNPYLLLLLNFVFSLVASALVVVLLARSFVIRGSAHLLVATCGLTAWGLAGSVGALAGLVGLGAPFANTLVTVHNLGVWMAAALQLAGALLLLRPGPPIRRTGFWLAVSQTIVVALVGIVAIATLAGWTPVFFVEGRGGTPVRQTVMFSASLLFAGAALALGSRPAVRRRVSRFESWYSAALSLIAVGLLGVTLQSVVGGLLGWTGRAAQYLSGVYFVVAAVAAARESRIWGVPLELAARDAAERFQRLFDDSSDGIWIHDLDGVVREVNDAYCRLSGYSRDELVGMHVSRLEAIEKPEEVAAHLRRLLETGGHDRFESRHRRKDGTLFDVDITAVFLDIDGGRVGISVRDVTDRSRAERARRESEERYRALFETMAEGFALHEIITDDHGRPCDYRFLEVNPAFERLTGLKAADLIGRRVLEILPGTESHWIDSYGRVALTGEPARFESHAAQLGRWYEVLAYRPAPRQFAVVFTDVTERRQTEQALRDSEQRLAEFLDNAPGIVWVKDLDGRFLRINRRAAAVLGKPAAEFTGRTVAELYPGTEGDAYAANDRQVVAAGSEMEFEETVRLADGPHTFMSAKFPVRDADGRIYGVGAICTDVTERKQAAALALQGQRTFAELVERAPFGIYVIDSQFRIAQMNAASQAGAFRNVRPLIGRDLGQAMRILWPEPVAAEIIGRFRHTLETGEPYYSPRFTNPREDVKAIESYEWELHRMLLPDGQHGVICYYFDSTELRDTEEALRQSVRAREMAQEQVERSHQKVREILDSIQDDFYVLDREWKFVFASRSFTSRIGKEPRDFLGNCIWEMFPKHLGTPLEENLRAAMQNGETRRFEIRGQYTSAVYSMTVFPSTEGITVLGADITARKGAEEALRQLNAELEQRVASRTAELGRAVERVQAERQRLFEVLETVPAMVCLLTPDYHVAFANQAFRKRFGESDGRHCYEYCFGLDAPCSFCESYRVMQTGQPHRWEVRAPDGSAIDAYDFPFIDADGSQMILEMDIDVTEQRRAEGEIRAAHAELAARAEQLRRLTGELTLAEQRERRRMAKVLHDHLQQLLVGARFRTAILGRAGDKLVAQGASEIEELLQESINASQSLTAELSPPILHEGGLDLGLEWLARWMADKHGLLVDLSMEEPLPALLEDVKVLLFESVRELLFNAVKHAHAHSVRVNARPIDGGFLQVTVSDAGAGFDPTALKPAGELGGFGLFSIRERLSLIGGRIEIDSAPGKGSRFILIAPISQVVAPTLSPGLEEPRAEADPPSVAAGPPAPGTRIRVLLADDHSVMREGLARLLGAEPDIEIVGQASDGREAVGLAARLLPDVVLMDLSMPGLNGVEATRAIHNDYPDIRIVGLSMFDEADAAQSLRDAGAVSYLTKSGPAADLLAAIRGGATGRLAAPVRRAKRGRRPAGRGRAKSRSGT